MAHHLPPPTQGLSIPGGQAFSASLSAPPRQASALGLEPPPSSAPKSTVSLFWVTTRHAQGISISACGASDSLGPFMQLTPSESVPPAPAPWAAPHARPGYLGSLKLALGPTAWKSTQPLTHWSPQGPLTPLLCPETPVPQASGTHMRAALG